MRCKKTKNPTATSEEPGPKSEYCACPPAFNTTKGVGKPCKPLLQSIAWTHLYPILYKEPASPLFPGGSDGKEFARNVGDLGSISGLGRSTGERNGYPLKYSGLENSMDKGAWYAIVHRVIKSQTGLSDFHCTELQPHLGEQTSEPVTCFCSLLLQQESQ